MEVEAVLEIHSRLERAKYLRAGLIAATYINMHRKPGAPMVKPGDFIRERPKPEDFMDVETARRVLDKWAEDQNKMVGEQQS